MSCFVCGKREENRSHIIPLGIAHIACGGKRSANALRQLSDNGITDGGRGVFDKHILCKTHDSLLGARYDDQALKVIKLLGKPKEKVSRKYVQVDCNVPARALELFAISVLLRASLSTRIDYSAGTENEVLWRDALFNSKPFIPRVMVTRIFDKEYNPKHLMHYPTSLNDNGGQIGASFMCAGLMFDVCTNAGYAKAFEMGTLSYLNQRYQPLALLKGSLSQFGTKNALLSRYKKSLTPLLKRRR